MSVVWIALEHQVGFLLDEPKDGLGEDGIGPREPAAGHAIAAPADAALDFDALVDQAEDADILDAVEALEDLDVVGARHGLHEDGHGPGVAQPDVRAADAGELVTGQEVRVAALREDHAPRVLVDGIVGLDEAEQREGEERGDVRVVHEQMRPVPVDLVGKDLAKLLVGDHRMLVDARFDRLGTGGEVVGDAAHLFRL